MTFVTPVLDNFNRANEGPPMTGWTDISNGVKVISNVCGGNVAGNNWSYWNAKQYGPNAECRVTITTMPTNNNAIALAVRLKDLGTGTTEDGYQLSATQLAGTDAFRAYRFDNGVATQLGADISQGFAINDQFMIRMLGSILEVWYASGGTTWSRLATRTDATYTNAGYLSLAITATTGRVDNFGGGDSMPVPAAPGSWLKPRRSTIKRM